MQTIVIVSPSEETAKMVMAAIRREAALMTAVLGNVPATTLFAARLGEVVAGVATGRTFVSIQEAAARMGQNMRIRAVLEAIFERALAPLFDGGFAERAEQLKADEPRDDMAKRLRELLRELEGVEYRPVPAGSDPAVRRQWRADERHAATRPRSELLAGCARRARSRRSFGRRRA